MTWMGWMKGLKRAERNGVVDLGVGWELRAVVIL